MLQRKERLKLNQSGKVTLAVQAAKCAEQANGEWSTILYLLHSNALFHLVNFDAALSAAADICRGINFILVAYQNETLNPISAGERQN